jgi:CheY-like chemotaxis protein
MIRLVDDLLDVSRISRNQLQLRKEPVALASALEQAIETSRPVMAAGGHELVAHLPPQRMELEGDLTRLVQVFANLLNNAAKFSPDGSKIWCTAEAFDAEFVVTVRDEGVGIPAGMTAKIFDMFTRVDQSLERSQDGLGIGLTLVKRLVELHGGSVEATSAGAGTGSAFIVRLPRLPLVGEVRAAPEGEAAPLLSALKILVADDNPAVAEILVEFLEMMGNTVQHAHDGQAAVAMAAAFRPDVIVMDIGMPKLNGYEACRRIREEAWGKSVVMIATTGWGQEDDKRRSREAAFDHHFVKPIDFNALEQLLANLR